MSYVKIDVRGFILALLPQQVENAQKQGWRYLRVESPLLPGVLYLDADEYTNVHGKKILISKCDKRENGVMVRVNEYMTLENKNIPAEIESHWKWKLPIPAMQFMEVSVWGFYNESLHMVQRVQPFQVQTPTNPQFSPIQTPVHIRDPSALLSSIGMNPRAETFTPTSFSESPTPRTGISLSNPPPMIGSFPDIMGMGTRKSVPVPENIQRIFSSELEEVVIHKPQPYPQPKVRTPLKSTNFHN